MNSGRMTFPCLTRRFSPQSGFMGQVRLLTFICWLWLSNTKEDWRHSMPAFLFRRSRLPKARVSALSRLVRTGAFRDRDRAVVLLVFELCLNADDGHTKHRQSERDGQTKRTTLSLAQVMVKPKRFVCTPKLASLICTYRSHRAVGR
jgi:hypothetical protein